MRQGVCKRCRKIAMVNQWCPIPEVARQYPEGEYCADCYDDFLPVYNHPPGGRYGPTDDTSPGWDNGVRAIEDAPHDTEDFE